jgi:hypothetical protein
MLNVLNYLHHFLSIQMIHRVPSPNTQNKIVFLLWYHKCLCETKSSVTKELFVKLCFFFFNTYYVGITVIAPWSASDISSELLLKIKTFDI